MIIKNAKIQQVIQVDYSDVEIAIQQEYGREDYSLPADMECGNDIAQTMFISKEELDECDTDDIQDFKDRKKHQWMTRLLMQDMCNRDLIPAGDYVISVSW